MPDILTLERVAECRERAERATDGPWKPSYGLDDVRVAIVRCGPYPYDDAIAKVYGNNNGEFIYHARTDIPALCATVEALREENERLRNVLTFVACGYACVHYPDQDRDHSGIQYPDCVDPDIECCVADALRARELSQ